MKAEVEVYQAQIGRVSIEDPVELTAEALPQSLKGKVTRIGLEVQRQTITDASPAASTDARIIRVTIALDERQPPWLAASPIFRSRRAFAPGRFMIARLLERLLGRLPIGWLQLSHSRARLAAALAGVAFANMLVLMQLGFMGAMVGSIRLPYDQFNADILISASDMNTLADGSPLSPSAHVRGPRRKRRRERDAALLRQDRLEAARWHHPGP